VPHRKRRIHAPVRARPSPRRNVKLFAWESLFLERIVAVRSREMKYLRVCRAAAAGPACPALLFRLIRCVLLSVCACLQWRKWLDALCVYFWATTPVLVSLATFSLYTYDGHKVRCTPPLPPACRWGVWMDVNAWDVPAQSGDCLHGAVTV
jgi:hypothetical protein